MKSGVFAHALTHFHVQRSKSNYLKRKQKNVNKVHKKHKQNN